MRLGVLLTGHAPDKASPGFRRSDDPSGMLGSDISATPFSAVYLIRPDQHVAARWSRFDAGAMRTALRKACAKD
jgi:3-(3-hydroxy-phenyl)propionate hydroxylase